MPWLTTYIGEKIGRKLHKPPTICVDFAHSTYLHICCTEHHILVSSILARSSPAFRYVDVITDGWVPLLSAHVARKTGHNNQHLEPRTSNCGFDWPIQYIFFTQNSLFSKRKCIKTVRLENSTFRLLV